MHYVDVDGEIEHGIQCYSLSKFYAPFLVLAHAQVGKGSVYRGTSHACCKLAKAASPS